jgi:hypothetical protein
MQLLLAAHPEGSLVSEIQQELDIPNSTLSHHLDKLRNEDLVRVARELADRHPVHVRDPGVHGGCDNGSCATPVALSVPAGEYRSGDGGWKSK